MRSGVGRFVVLGVAMKSLAVGYFSLATKKIYTQTRRLPLASSMTCPNQGGDGISYVTEGKCVEDTIGKT